MCLWRGQVWSGSFNLFWFIFDVYFLSFFKVDIVKRPTSCGNGALKVIVTVVILSFYFNIQLECLAF